MYRIYTIKLSIYADNITEARLRELVDQGICSLCHFLESNTTHDHILYNIAEIQDLD